MLPMEAAVATDLSADAINVAHTTPTAPMASMATTTAITKPNDMVKEWTAIERKVQNQKRQARQVAEQARKAEALVAALEEEKPEHLSKTSKDHDAP
jgi:ADP-ribosylglycohydrolase